MRIVFLVFVTALVFIATTRPSYAYIDPGTGTFLLQILAAIGLGIAFYFRRALNAVKNLFRRKSDKDE